MRPSCAAGPGTTAPAGSWCDDAPCLLGHQPSNGPALGGEPMGTLDATHELELFDDVTPCVPPSSPSTVWLVADSMVRAY